MKLELNNRFTAELTADAITDNFVRIVPNAHFSFVTPKIPSKPKIIHISRELAYSLGFSDEDLTSDDFISIFSGKEIYRDSKPYAMCYAGHQFGNWAGQLGDGRAINLFEISHKNQTFAFQLKGAGKTPYSRRGDGFAVLRSSIREHLCSEAMYHLGIPTTRSLSLALSGDEVLRDMLYDGNADYEKGAIVCRIAPSFIRFGNFEVFAAQNDIENLKKLADFTIKYHYPEIQSHGKEKYLDFFKMVSKNTLEMILHWQLVGFVHGVMNTDNMSILGLTIDYGPYGWLEDYNPNWTPNTTDNQEKRYRFGNQSSIAQWNLMQLANALYPLIEEVKPLEGILNNFSKNYELGYQKMMQSKLGLNVFDENDTFLIADLEQQLQKSETDMTIFFRNLANVSINDDVKMAFSKVKDAFYLPINNPEIHEESWIQWFQNYIVRLQLEQNSDEERKQEMNLVNPKYVLRNYMAQLAIDEAEKENYNLIQELYELLQKPYEEQPQYEKWFSKRPDWARTKIGCSALSCSS